MALTYGFFNSVEGDRLYTAEQIGKFLHGLVSSGVYADKSDSLQVMAAGGMAVTVRPGRGMLDYHWLEVDEPYGLALAAGGALPRVDGIVMRLDMVNRRIELAVTQGAPSNTPAVPAVVRTDAIKEYLLAKISVPALATEITQKNITDTRGYDYVCGFVTGLIKQLDTSTLFEQWQAAYEEAYAELGNYLDAQRAAWEMFFANVTEDNVLPAPSLDDTGKVPRVNAAADGYVLAPVYAENLLDNSYFKKPVNQRGAATYTGSTGGNTPTIDRWRAMNDTTVTIAQAGISVAASNSVYQNGIRQGLPHGTLTAGEKYTLAVKMADGKVYAATMTATSAAEVGGTLTTGVDAALRIFDTEPAQYADIRLTSGTTAGIVWAALYEGEYTAETLPEYRPKGYAAELLECQRYYWRTNFDGNTYGFAGHVQSGTEARISVPCPVMMRANPTVTGDVSNMSIIPSLGSPTAIAGTQADAACVHLRLAGTYSTTGIVCLARFNKTFEFSAEL